MMLVTQCIRYSYKHGDRKARIMDYQGAKNTLLSRLRAELSPKLTYHGVHHTLDVLRVTEELCVLESVTGKDRDLLCTAAVFHDSGFLRTYQQHEKASCQIALEELPRWQYTHEDIDQICAMIMATKVPQEPGSFLAEILCDADLDYLGRDDFYTIGDTLFQELVAFGYLSTEHEWNRLQVSFLSQHRYFTTTNQARRKPRKNQYLQELRQWVAAHSG